MRGRYRRARAGEQRRGMLLVLVLLYLALTTAVALVITAGTRQQVRVHAEERGELLLRQMLDSGVAWSAAAGEAWPVAGSVTLDAGLLAPTAQAAAVTLTPERNEDGHVRSVAIEARVEHGDRAQVRRAVWRRPG